MSQTWLTITDFRHILYNNSPSYISRIRPMKYIHMYSMSKKYLKNSQNVWYIIEYLNDLF